MEFLEAEAALFPSPSNSSISELPIFFHCSMHVNPSADPILCWLLKFTVSLKSRWFDSSDFIPFQIILLVDGLFFERLSSPPPRHGFSFLHTSVHLSHSGEFGSLCVFFLKEIGPFYSRARIYVRRVARRVSYQLFHSRSVRSVILSLIPNISDLRLLKLLFFSLVGGLSNALIFFSKNQ